MADRIGKPISQRQLRVGEMIKQSLSMIFIKNEAKVPSHLAVLLTIIILIALIVQPLQVALSSGNVGKILRSSVMIITSATSTIAFIVSFINVRRKKENL